MHDYTVYHLRQGWGSYTLMLSFSPACEQPLQSGSTSVVIHSPNFKIDAPATWGKHTAQMSHHLGAILSVIDALIVWFNSLRLINNLSVIKGWDFLGRTNTKLGLMCLAIGHNTVTPVRLDHAAPRSQVKHSTTEPLRSLGCWCMLTQSMQAGKGTDKS